MGVIHLIVIQHNRILTGQIPRQDLFTAFNINFSHIPQLLQKNATQQWIDCGYILLDYDHHLYAFRQDGFYISQLNSLIRNKLRREWIGIEAI